MISSKRKWHFFGAKRLKWFQLFSGIDNQESVSKQEHKEAMSPRHSTYIPSSLKSPLTCVNYKLFITFQQDDGFLNEPIKIDEQIKLANQLIQRRTRDRNG